MTLRFSDETIAQTRSQAAARARPVRSRRALAVMGIAAVLQGCVAAAVGTGAAVGGSIAYDRRSTGAYIDDEIIELKAINALGSDEELYDRSHINTTSFNNIVLLTGEAPTEELRAAAERYVTALPKVRKVYNELAVAAPSAMLSRSSDSLTTSKVKASLLEERVNLFGRTKVVTEAGVVFLMGLLTHAEADVVTDVARRVGGVQRVVKVFEYIDKAPDPTLSPLPGKSPEDQTTAPAQTS